MKTLILSLLMSFGLLSSAVAAPGGGGGGGSYGGGPSAAEPRKTPEQRAVEHYQRGIKNRDKAIAFETDALTEEKDKKKQKLNKKAQKEYARAQSRFEKTLKTLPGAFEAHSDLGFVLRKQGQYDESLAAYNRALALNAAYMPAIEYRAEAYLALNRLDEAKEAYMALFREDRKMADRLMGAMQRWVQNAGVRSGISEESKQAFGDWVNERLNIGMQTFDLSPNGKNPWQTASR